MVEGTPRFFNTAMELYNAQKYREGYTFVTEHAGDYPEYIDRSFSFRICFAAKSGELDLAEELLEDALDQGCFFSKKALREDEDLIPLQKREFFNRLVARDLNMLEDAQGNARPLLQILRPNHRVTDEKDRFLMSLHCNLGNLRRYLPLWEFIPRTDWLAAIPQSSQVGGSHTFVWDNKEIALKEVRDHYQTVLKHFTPDPQLSLMIGYSMGGHIALRAALEQTFPIRGFLLVCPAFGEVDAWMPMIEAAQGLGLKGYFLLGEMDEPVTTNAKAMQKILEQHGINAGVEVFAGIWHEFPPDFEQVFERVTREIFNE